MTAEYIENVLLSELASGWSEHLKKRIFDAIEIGMIDRSTWLEPHVATVLLPKSAPNTRNKIQPETSISDVVGDSNAGEQWIKRLDLLPDASSVICKLSRELCRYLICEAGYSKVGDRSLSRFKNFSHGGSPFIYTKITHGNSVEVEALLKAARSFRLLGLISETDYAPIDFKGRNIAFLCDALDGDSIIICPQNKQEEISCIF